MSIFGGDAVARRAPVVGTTGTATTTGSRKHVTPKWVDRLLVAAIVAIPVLYGLGVSFEIGPSMNHLGLIYVVKWGTLPTQPGQIIRLASAELPAWRKYVVGSMVKRFTGFTSDGHLMFEGDNSEWSRDNRDGLKPVPPDHIAGVVVAAFSPRRFIRMFTAEGRFENKLALKLRSEYYVVSGKLLAAWFPNENTTRIYAGGTQIREFKTWRIQSLSWKDGAVLLGREPNPLQWEYISYCPATDKVLAGLDGEGKPVIRHNFPAMTMENGTRIEGGLVLATDKDPATSWIIDSTSPSRSFSKITFLEPFTGKMDIKGGWGSGASLSVSVNGEPPQAFVPPWKEQTVELRRAVSVVLVANKMVNASGQWVITSITFTH